MRSASPLIKNDPRLQSLVEQLKTGASLKVEAIEWGYASEQQLRHALRELLGEEVFRDALKKRPLGWRKNVPNALPAGKYGSRRA